MEYIILYSIAIIIVVIVTLICKKYLTLISKKKEEYERLQSAVETLVNERNRISNDIDKGKTTLNDIRHKVDFTDQILKDLNQQYDKTKDHLDNLKQIAEDNEAKLKEEYDNTAQQYKDKLAYVKETCDAEKAIIEFDLESLKQTRHAAIEQWRKQQQDKNQLDGYKLNITSQDKKDIQLLQNIRLQFSHPRVISKLIWQTYFQPLAKQQFIMILGNETKCGIYKITNILDNKCYIGQSVDIYKRWCDHCKCGCGIDTPKNNKLYAAMEQDGIENFTFELLEECPREELNKKEAFYIDLYESNDYGYNQTIGVN
jgi:hypothetical protein